MTTYRPLETIADLLAAARREGLDLSADGAILDTMGLDFIVVHARDAAGTPWIVRSPRRESVVEAAKTEARILAAVAPTLRPVAVPDWRVHADDVIAYPRIAGTPAVTLDTGAPVWNIIDPAAPSDIFIDSMARVLTALQSVMPSDVPTLSADDDRAALAKTIEAVRDALEPSEAMWARWQRFVNAPWPTHRALSHGDLHPGHMILDTSGALIGVLDWTEGKVADPSLDLAMFHTCFGRPALERLVARLEAHGFRTWPGIVEHAIERAAISHALGAEWALRHGNDAVLAHTKAMLAAAT